MSFKRAVVVPAVCLIGGFSLPYGGMLLVNARQCHVSFMRALQASQLPSAQRKPLGTCRP